MQCIAGDNPLSKESKNDHNMRGVVANLSHNFKLQNSYKYGKQ